ncbi:MAG: 50S ribosomal protein L25 [Lachnospiraceae bacterium]|nr:50S ribosomal protein L25 [Lachnospiraceae bacterium]
MDTLKAEKRDLSTKAKKLRREGYVTGNIIGREIEGSLPIQMEAREAERVLRTKRKGGQLYLDVDGQKMDVLIKEIHYNAAFKRYDEVDFQALVSTEKVHSVAEIILLNHEKVQNGIVQTVLSEVAYKALPSALVETIEIDVENLKPGDTVKVGDLPIASDPNVDLTTSRDAVVVLIAEPHISAAEEEPAEEATADEKAK